jgi:hypothetical protein
MARLACLFSVCLFAACGTASRPFGDGGMPPADAKVIDAHPPDAVPQLPPTPARETVNGGGHVSGPTYSMDVEIGQPVVPQKASGATHTIQPNAAIQP